MQNCREICDFYAERLEVYWQTKDSFRSKFSSTKLERIAGPATMRNMTTIQRLAAKLIASSEKGQKIPPLQKK